MEITSDGQIRLADRAVAAHGVLLDQINLGPRPGFGNKFPISDFDAVVVDGDTPTVCPKTDRPIPAEWLPTIEGVFKRVGLVKPGQTIHWVGGQAKLENICTCFREGFPKPAATLTGNAPNSGLIERLLAGPDDAELSPREMAMLEAHLAQPVSMATIQREKQATGESATNAQRNKLKLIRDFNRNLRDGATGEDGDAGETETPLPLSNDTGQDDDALPAKQRKLAPSRLKAKALYEWAASQIPGAEDMTIQELFSAIESHPSDASEALPPNPETFGKYLRDAGVRKYSTQKDKAQGKSVQDAGNL
jgi:hypothetical protein